MIRSVAIVAIIEQDANVTHVKCTTLTYAYPKEQNG